MAAIHHLHQCQNRLLLLQHSSEALVKQLSKLEELPRVQLSYHLHILSQQLKWYILLQLHSSTRRARQEKSKVNVNNMTVSTQ
jgi:hypothetical protein